MKIEELHWIVEDNVIQCKILHDFGGLACRDEVYMILGFGIYLLFSFFNFGVGVVMLFWSAAYFLKGTLVSNIFKKEHICQIVYQIVSKKYMRVQIFYV